MNHMAESGFSNDFKNYFVDVKCDECGQEVSDVFLTCGSEAVVKEGEKLGDGLYERRKCEHYEAENTITAVRPY